MSKEPATPGAAAKNATQVVLFEDHLLADMNPITLTRPAFAVTCACATLYEVASAAADRVGWVVREALAKVTARAWPAAAPLPGAPALYLNASIVPDARYGERFRAILAEGRPFVATTGERVSAAYLPAGTPVPERLTAEKVTPWLLELKLPLLEEELFKTFDHQFEVIKYLEPLFAGNLAARLARGSYREVKPGVFAAENVTVADTAIFRTKDGPIVFEHDVEAMDFTYFVGPVHVGARSRIIERASLKEQVCIGEVCKVGGEVERSVIESYTNKQHHGFLGHSWVGSWVNMGAGTSNSDLKNTYGEVRLEYPHRRVDTGMQFLGCVIGDYAKSAINTSIFTGKIIGVSSMLYGAIGSNVPSFCNYARSFGQITECPVDQAILIQKRMFARRGIAQTADDAELLRNVFEQTRQERLISDEPPAL
jgi:UDP-N-acetylglucosamine diphosphorylase / glucose-1-phosphate thymidylyltransferase / UDP-N-acetylgalactosamine diphosphorylase / glucosamine-1-phosphate N-acetyltransferase / galactosamine-1-phosphate N-acetyltransferase